MLTRKMVNTTGVIGLVLMVALFCLVVFRVVPERMYMTLGLIALALFLMRISLRLILLRQERLEARRQGDEVPDPTRAPAGGDQTAGPGQEA